MKKKLLSVLLSVAMVATMLAGCGAKEEAAAPAEEAAVEEAAPAEEAEAAAPAEETAGEPFYVYSWNTEAGDRIRDYVSSINPEVAERMVYVNVGDSAIYQEKIDALLQTPDAEDYPDLIAAEAAYIMKYTNSDYTLPVTDLGITEADLAEMYPYTIQIATDQRDGSLKGLSWQACPGSFMYRRSLAEKYLGTSDPAEVQEYVKDWDTFIETAKMINEKSGGATKILSSNDDIQNVFFSNKSEPWVNADKQFVYDASLDKMMDVYYELEQNDLTAKTTCWS